MKYEKYESVITTSDFLNYEFVSTGPKGSINKMVQFTSTGHPDIFNLALGSLWDNGFFDDMIVDNNQDRNKVLATVASIVYEFCIHYPQKWIFFSGNTAEKTRLYRIAITLNFKELSADFEILGVLQDIEEGFVNVPFQKNINYFGLIFKRKKA